MNDGEYVYYDTTTQAPPETTTSSSGFDWGEWLEKILGGNTTAAPAETTTANTPVNNTGSGQISCTFS